MPDAQQQQMVGPTLLQILSTAMTPALADLVNGSASLAATLVNQNQEVARLQRMVEQLQEENARLRGTSESVRAVPNYPPPGMAGMPVIELEAE